MEIRNANNLTDILLIQKNFPIVTHQSATLTPEEYELILNNGGHIKIAYKDQRPVGALAYISVKEIIDKKFGINGKPVNGNVLKEILKYFPIIQEFPDRDLVINITGSNQGRVALFNALTASKDPLIGFVDPYDPKITKFINNMDLKRIVKIRGLYHPSTTHILMSKN